MNEEERLKELAERLQAAANEAAKLKERGATLEDGRLQNAHDDYFVIHNLLKQEVKPSGPTQ